MVRYPVTLWFQSHTSHNSLCLIGSAEHKLKAVLMVFVLLSTARHRAPGAIRQLSDEVFTVVQT